MRLTENEQDVGAGIRWISKGNAPDDVMGWIREGDDYPWLIVDPVNERIVKGDGTAWPTASLSPGGDAAALGSLIVHSHSFGAGVSWKDQWQYGFRHSSVIPHLMGKLGIGADDILHLGVGASRACQPSLKFFGSNPSGWAVICQFLVPPQSTIRSGPVIATAAGGFNPEVLTPYPGAHLFIHAVNDFGSVSFGVPADIPDEAQVWENTIRHYLSRTRAGAMWGSYAVGGATPTITWDSMFSFTGTWTDVLQGAGGGSNPIVGSGAAIKRTASDGDTCEFTLPSTLPPNAVFTIEFMASIGFDLPLDGNFASGATSLDVIDGFTMMPQSGSFTIHIGTEDIEVTATTGGGTPTLTCVATTEDHSDGDRVTRARPTDIAFSCDGDGQLGGVDIAGQTLATGGQAAGGFRAPIVARFPVTAADAGKTLTATAVLPDLDNDDIAVSCAYLETVDAAPPVVLVNAQRVVPHIPESVNLAPAYNERLVSVAAEFDQPNAIQIADHDGFLWERSAILAAATDGSQTSIEVTANSTKFSEDVSGGNFRVRLDDESIIVGALEGTYPNFTLTGCTRGADGTSNVAHALTTGTSGSPKPVARGDLVGIDSTHPTEAGAAALAELIYAAFSDCTLEAVPRNPARTTHAARWGYGQRRRTVGVGNGDVIKAPQTKALVSRAPTLGHVMYHQIEIPEPLVIVGMHAFFAVAAAPTTVRFGVYDEDASDRRPGTLYREFGTIAGNAAGGVVEVVGHLPIDPGIYWFCVVQQGGTAQAMACLDTAGTTLLVPTSNNIDSLTDLPYVGIGSTGLTSGALPASPANSTPRIGGAAAATDAVAAIGLRVLRKQWFI